MNLEYNISVPEQARDGIDIHAEGVGVPLEQALTFALAIIRTVTDYGAVSVQPKASDGH